MLVLLRLAVDARLGRSRLLPRSSTLGAALLASVLAVGCGDANGVRSLDQAFDGLGGAAGYAGGLEPGDTAPGTCGVSTTGLVAYLPFDGDARVVGGSGIHATSPSSSAFVQGR
ncbi:MAG TPA: hypothetical protein VM580_07740, partial [Labilithrix sp.]|nr:hypothetical protein [Labilithrix sp.]